jgi:Uma2 family endonuclease
MTLMTSPVEAAKPDATAPTYDPQPRPRFTLENVSWELYELLLRDVAGQHVRITYDSGRMVLMSPLPIHDKLKKMIGMLIEATAVTLGIPMAMLGSTTWKRRDLAEGLEADACYYIQNEARVRALKGFDLTRDPPPDLAVEIEVTHNPIDRPSIYAALGVGEVWRHDGQRVQFLKLGPDRTYQPCAASVALPMLTPADIDRHLALLWTVPDTDIIRRFRDWLLSRSANACGGGHAAARLRRAFVTASPAAPPRTARRKR